MLNVSIVLYQPDWAQIADLTRSLLQCAEVRCVYSIGCGIYSITATWATEQRIT